MAKSVAALVFLIGIATAAQAEPVNRWSSDGMRANRVTRPGDIYVRPPVRAYPKAAPKPWAVPKPDPKLEPLPRYGKPKPAIERIPPT